MSYPVLRDFIATVADAGDDDQTRVIIVTGSGGSFCAGTDLSNLSDRPPTSGARRPAAAPPPARRLAAHVVPEAGNRRRRWCRVGMGAEFVTQPMSASSPTAPASPELVHRGLVPDTAPARGSCPA